jgi:osmotically-inducible protein OsmY
MTDSRDRSDQRDQVGRSGFAQRGQSHEERMSEDDSARRFPGEARTREDARYDQSRRAPQPQQREPYGSGGSYGYGGGFEHQGERGYEEPQRGNYGRGAEEFYEATGGFGHDVGYGREGLGYPGRGEDRYGSSGSQGFRRPPQPRDDARGGYTQDSGFAQSGGARKESGQGASGYGRGVQHSDGAGHEGGGRGGRFFGNSSGGQPGRGRFYGRTPQGYTRSDERIREDVCDQLSHGHIDPSDISVKVEGGVVTLEGFAESRAEKFHAEEVTDSVLGVKDIENRLRIRKPDAPREQAAQAAPAAKSESEEANKPRNGARS